MIMKNVDYISYPCGNGCLEADRSVMKTKSLCPASLIVMENPHYVCTDNRYPCTGKTVPVRQGLADSTRGGSMLLLRDSKMKDEDAGR